MSVSTSSKTLHSSTADAASFATDPIDLRTADQASFQVDIDAATASFTAALQHSVDGTTWANVATPTAVTADATLMFTLSDVPARYYRMNFTRTSGTLDATVVKVFAKSRR